MRRVRNKSSILIPILRYTELSNHVIIVITLDFCILYRARYNFLNATITLFKMSKLSTVRDKVITTEYNTEVKMP